MFSIQQFFGKHLLLILLTIALGGAIATASFPQLRQPVTDYLGETFGPKADVASSKPATKCSDQPPIGWGKYGFDPYTSFNLTSKFAVRNVIPVGGTAEWSLNHNYEPAWAWNKTVFPNGHVNENWDHLGLDQIAIYFPKVQKGTCPACYYEYLKFFEPIDPHQEADADINSWRTSGDGLYLTSKNLALDRYQRMYKFNSGFDEKGLPKIQEGGFDGHLKTGEYKTTLRFTKSSNGWVLLKAWTSTNFFAIGSERYKQQPEVGTNWNNIWGSEIPVCVYDALILKPVDPNDTTKAKTIALADNKDKIKVLIEMKDYMGNKISINNLTISSTSGYLSQLGENFTQAITSQGNTISTTSSDGFYIKNDKKEKVTITAKTFIEGNEVSVTTDVSFAEPILSHQIDKSEADSNGKDYITYTLTAKNVDGSAYAGQKVDASFIINKGWLEIAQDNKFTNVSKLSALQDKPNDPQLYKNLTTDEKGQVKLYLRSKDFTQAKLTGVLHFADRTIGTDDKGFKDIAFKGERIILEKDKDQVYGDGIDYQIITATVRDKDNNPVKDTQVDFSLSFEKDQELKTCQSTLFTEKDEIDEGKWQSCANKRSPQTNDAGQVKIAIKAEEAGKTIVSASAIIKEKSKQAEPVEFKFTTARLELNPAETTPADGKTINYVEIKLDNSDGRFKKDPDLVFNINKTDKSVKLKINKVDYLDDWADKEENWQDSPIISGTMWPDKKNFYQYVALKTDVPNEVELSAKVLADDGKTHLATKKTKFVPSYSTPQFYVMREGIKEPQLLNEVDLKFHKVAGGILSFDKFQSEDILIVSESESNFKQEELTSKINFLGSVFYAGEPIKLVKGKNILAKFNLIIEGFPRENRLSNIDFVQSFINDNGILQLDFIYSPVLVTLFDTEVGTLMVSIDGDYLNPVTNKKISHFSKSYSIKNQENYFSLLTADLEETDNLESVIAPGTNIISLNINVFEVGQPVITPLNIINVDASGKEIITNWDEKNPDNNEVYPGNKLTIKIKPNVGSNFKKLKTELEIPDFTGPLMDTLSKSATYDKDRHVISWQYNKNDYDPNKEEVFELKLNNQIPISEQKGGSQRINQSVLLTARNFIDDLPLTIKDEQGNDIKKTNREIGLWGIVKGQLTGPYNNQYRLVDDGSNQPLPSMGIALLNEDNGDITRLEKGKDYAFTDKDGNFTLKFRRPTLTGKNRVKLQLKYILYNPKDGTLDGSDNILIEGKNIKGETFTIRSQAFKLDANSTITNQNFKIREKQSDPKWESPDSVEEVGIAKTLSHVMINLLEAMKIIKGLLPTLNYPQLTIMLSETNDFSNVQTITLSYSEVKSWKNGATLFLRNNRYPSIELHEFAHYLDFVSGVKSAIDFSKWRCNHCGYGNDDTGDSRSEGIANFLSVYLNNKLYGNHDLSNWDPSLHWPKVGARSIWGIYPTFALLYENPDYIIMPKNPNGGLLTEESGAVANVFHFLTRGVKSEKRYWLAKNVPWFDQVYEGQLGGKIKHSMEEVDKETQKLLEIVFSGKTGNMYQFFQQAKKYWSTPEINYHSLSLIEQLSVLNGFFHDQDQDWKWDWNDKSKEEIGRAANSRSFKAKMNGQIESIPARPERQFPEAPDNAQIKFNFLQSKVVTDNWLDYKVQVVHDPAKNQGVKLYDEDGSLINLDYEYLASAKNGESVLLIPPDSLYGAKVFVTTLDSANYLAVDNSQYWQAVEEANKNNIAPGYIAIANFTIQPQDPEKGISAAVPPTLQQMQAMEAEKEKIRAEEQAKALAAQKALEEAKQKELEKLEQEKIQKEKEAEAKIKAEQLAKAQLAAEKEELAAAKAAAEQAAQQAKEEAAKLAKEKAELEQKAQEAEEQRLKDLEALKEVQQKELAAQQALLEQEKAQAAAMARLELEKKQIEEENARIKEELAKQEAEIAKLNQEKEEYQARIKALEDKLAQANQEKAALQTEKTQLAQQLTQAREENQLLDQANLLLQQTLNSFKQHLQQVEISNLEKDKTQKQEQLALINTQLQLTQAKEYIQDLEQKKEQLEQSQTKITRELDTSKLDISKLEQIIQTLNSQLTTLSSDLADSQQTIQQIKQGKADLQQQLSQAKEEGKTLAQLNLTLQQTITNLRLKLAEEEAKRQQAQQQAKLAELQRKEAELAQQQAEARLLQTQQELQDKELALFNQQIQAKVTQEQEKKQIITNDLDQQLAKKEEEIKKKEQEKEQIQATINNTIKATPIIQLEPTKEVKEQQLAKAETSEKIQDLQQQTQREAITIQTTQDQANHTSGLQSQTQTQEPLKTKTNQELIIKTDNFQNTDNLTVFLDEQKIAETPILTEQTDLKVTIPETDLGNHTVTVKDDLGNQASQEIKVSQNKYFNPTTFGYGMGTLAILILGLMASKIFVGKFSILG